MKDKGKLTGKNPSNLKQAIILNLALQEAEIEPRDCTIRINHDKGISYVNDVELPIIFPKKWFKHTSKLHTLKKEYKFYFNGHIGKGSSREKLLEKFIEREDCKVVWSDDGRVIAKKDKYNTEYFTGLAKSEYGLCPHQPGWKGDMDALWTYRYIECLMSKVIPVNFRETPLSINFTGDSYYVWDDNILETDRDLDKDLLDHNYNFALGKFTLNPKQVRTIKKVYEESLNICMETVVLVTGGFDPIHSGHIEYFKSAKALGDHLIVGINSDEWLRRKKGQPFMPFEERAAIVKALSMVDEVIGFNDDDDSACAAIMQVLSTKGSSVDVIFANGGDRINTNTPEYNTYKNHPDVNFVWGVGGSDKKNSSSWILEEWKNPKTHRAWGWYRVLDDQPEKGYKVKELVIAPGKHLSDQRHECRAENWYILDNEVTINLDDGRVQNGIRLEKNTSLVIGKGVWHKAMNDSDKPTHVLEVQFGEKCIEEDIERRD